MAGPNEIMRGGLNAVLHKTLSMKEGAPAAILGAEVIPILVLENDRPEWAFLANEFLAGGFAERTAPGLGRSRYQLRNPAGSGAIAVIESLLLTTAGPGATSTLQVHTYIAGNLTQGLLANQAFLFPADTRAANGATNEAPVPILFREDDTNAQPLGSSIIAKQWMLVPAGAGGKAELLPDGPIILSPGTQCFVECVCTPVGGTITTALSVRLRVRTIEPSETR